MTVTILDYGDNKIHIIEVPKEMEKEFDDNLIEDMGFKLDEVNYMISDSTPSLIINTEALKTF
jgi:hypothetical protein